MSSSTSGPPGAPYLAEIPEFVRLQRNTLIGPGLIAPDLAANKTFRLREGHSLQFRTEVFNSLNHPNFSIPSQRALFSSTGAVGSAGLITTTKTSSRQLQFGLKLTF